MTRSHIPTVNIPARIIVPEGQSGDVIANEFKARLKRGRPINSKDKILWKRKGQVKTYGEFNTPEQFGAPKDSALQKNHIIELKRFTAPHRTEIRCHVNKIKKFGAVRFSVLRK